MRRSIASGACSKTSHASRAASPARKITETVDDRTYRANVGIKVGPVNVSYDATIVVEELDDAKHHAQFSVSGNETRGRGGVRAGMSSDVEAVGSGRA